MPKDLSAETPSIVSFIAALEQAGYCGEATTDPAIRAVMATDNSVYEVTPAVVLFPREPDDLNRIMRAALATGMPLCARGGGTGTNGQSLTDGAVVDCSRHLSRIEKFDPEAGVAVVQPGVVLDDLNRAAAEHGLFFAPHVSTASRATLGGMVATDASGKGSRVYGRTSDHIERLDVVLGDGSDWSAETLDRDAMERVCARDDLPGRLHRHLRAVAQRRAAEIARIFPAMNRGLTGYNLKQIYDDGHDRFRLVKLLAGSEGTLTLTKRITLRLLPRPAHRALAVLAYDDALAALRDVPRLVTADPLAVEFIDDKIVDLARDDPIWPEISHVLQQNSARTVKGLNFVEVIAHDAAGLDTARERLADLGTSAPPALVSAKIVTDAATADWLWALRAKAVGLLGRMDPARQGTAFVEDAAVPPEALADFVAGFRSILDAHGLRYGMFGHADVGCLHVRPALDMRLPADAAKLRPVSDAVAALVRQHSGLLWGEHGKGVRGEYGPAVLGPELYREMCRIKELCDPANLLNPGKIAAADPRQSLLRIDEVQLRGPLDAAIAPARLEGYERAVKCNGNGQCFGTAKTEVMCPTYKATGDRRYSPKGRATLLRHWLRLGPEAAPARRAAAESALKDSLDACLSCKACTTQCPVQVDIPDMRSRFLDSYYARHRRPLRHHLLSLLEPLSPLLRLWPRMSSSAMRLMAPAFAVFGLVDLPEPHPAATRSRPANQDVTQRIVVLMEDTFLATFDGAVIDAAEQVLTALGYHVERVSPRPNGKALHTLGRQRAFGRVARRAVAREEALARAGHPVLGLDPAMIDLSHRDYAHFRAGKSPLRSIEAFLTAEIARGALEPARPHNVDATPFTLFEHCTGQATDPAIFAHWQRIFGHFGQTLKRQRVSCCGMAGVFGHEVAHQETSRILWEMSWAGPLAKLPSGRALANGFSCRCQAKRFGAGRLPHPIEALVQFVDITATRAHAPYIEETPP